MLKVIYSGTPASSSVVLESLLENQGEYKIVAVLTNPPAPYGRHKEPKDSPVALAAKNHNIPVLCFDTLKESAREEVSKYCPDILVCFNYGKIFGFKFLSLFKLGGINLHPSLLPKYRGASPIVCAILNQEKQTGVSVQKIALKADTGDILQQKVVEIAQDDTQDTLLKKCTKVGATMLVDILLQTAKTNILPPATQQTGEPSFCSLIKKQDTHIDWHRPALEICAKVRAYSAAPCAYAVCQQKILKILKATPVEYQETQPLETLETSSRSYVESCEIKPCGTVITCDKKNGILIKTLDSCVKLLCLQWQGKKALQWQDFINGTKDFLGKILV